MSKIFPKSANALPLQIVIFLFVLGSVATAAVTYYSTPKYLRVGYQPIQPVPFDHSLHAGNLAIDCRYCHTAVEKSGTWNCEHKVLNVIETESDEDGHRDGFQIDLVTMSICG